jgi:RNA polymerase sigma-70 factor (ECF subfamily)
MMEHAAQLGLLQEAKLAREDEFAALVERQARFVFRVAYARLRSGDDAEDVAQEVFLKVYRLGEWRSIQDERAYLARAAWRIATDRLARVRRRPTEEFDDKALRSAAENPEEAAISADWSAVVRRLMDSLPEELRMPLVLSAIEELKSGEIAEMLGIPEGTVRTRTMKARQILREKLTRLRGEKYAR